ncbi:unnamed protein product [Prunus armeniaca]|uniref:Uncharacterized protein n=1 Tax=Prunus armeniaca TaxID=36596 RepID=A0A6J5XU18_PRUAR|nr:unnamed protein product [Prunus armeniaca]
MLSMNKQLLCKCLKRHRQKPKDSEQISRTNSHVVLTTFNVAAGHTFLPAISSAQIPGLLQNSHGPLAKNLFRFSALVAFEPSATFIFNLHLTHANLQ